MNGMTYVSLAHMIETLHFPLVEKLSGLTLEVNISLLGFPQLRCPYNPKQNSVSKNKNKHRHLLDTIALFFIPLRYLSPSGEKIFWPPLILSIAAHPLFFWQYTLWSTFNEKSNYFTLCPFRCTCFFLLSPQECSKLISKSTIYVFLSNGIEHKGFRYFDPKDNHLCISRHVTFLEHILMQSQVITEPVDCSHLHDANTTVTAVCITVVLCLDDSWWVWSMEQSKHSCKTNIHYQQNRQNTKDMEFHRVKRNTILNCYSRNWMYRLWTAKPIDP